MIQLIATSKFKKQGLQPQPGMQVNVDNNMGMVKSVSGGRTLVDFNHPLSGRDVEYDVKVLEKVEDPIEQVQELLGNLAGIKPAKVEFAGEDKTHVKVTLSQMLPKPVQKAFSDRITQLVNIKKLEFVIGKE